MKVYVVLDNDMHMVWGTYSTIEKAIAALVLDVSGLDYKEINISIDEDEWQVIMPHKDPECAAHFSIVKTTVDED